MNRQPQKNANQVDNKFRCYGCCCCWLSFDKVCFRKGSLHSRTASLLSSKTKSKLWPVISRIRAGLEDLLDPTPEVDWLGPQNTGPSLNTRSQIPANTSSSDDRTNRHQTSGQNPQIKIPPQYGHSKQRKIPQASHLHPIFRVGDCFKFRTQIPAEWKCCFRINFSLQIRNKFQST